MNIRGQPASPRFMRMSTYSSGALFPLQKRLGLCAPGAITQTSCLINLDVLSLQYNVKRAIALALLRTGDTRRPSAERSDTSHQRAREQRVQMMPWYRPIIASILPTLTFRTKPGEERHENLPSRGSMDTAFIDPHSRVDLVPRPAIVSNYHPS